MLSASLQEFAPWYLTLLTADNSGHLSLHINICPSKGQVSCPRTQLGELFSLPQQTMSASPQTACGTQHASFGKLA
jgi:hypothetical protein